MPGCASARAARDGHRVSVADTLVPAAPWPFPRSRLAGGRGTGVNDALIPRVTSRDRTPTSGTWSSGNRRDATRGSVASDVARTDAPGDAATEGATADGALVRRARTGDAEAFASLVGRHLEAVHGAALAALGGHAADAEDVAQDAFIAALERLDACEPPEKFRAWLLVIARNRALDLRRRQRVRLAEPLDVPSPDGAGPLAAVIASAAPTPLAAAERADARAHLVAALATLSETRREIVLLHDVQGWTHREIAEQLGLAAGTVRAHLFWARRALRERLSAEWRGPAAADTSRPRASRDEGRAEAGAERPASGEIGRER